MPPNLKNRYCSTPHHAQPSRRPLGSCEGNNRKAAKTNKQKQHGAPSQEHTTHDNKMDPLQLDNEGSGRKMANLHDELRTRLTSRAHSRISVREMYAPDPEEDLNDEMRRRNNNNNNNNNTSPKSRIKSMQFRLHMAGKNSSQMLGTATTTNDPAAERQNYSRFDGDYEDGSSTNNQTTDSSWYNRSESSGNENTRGISSSEHLTTRRRRSLSPHSAKRMGISSEHGYRSHHRVGDLLEDFPTNRARNYSTYGRRNSAGQGKDREFKPRRRPPPTQLIVHNNSSDASRSSQDHSYSSPSSPSKRSPRSGRAAARRLSGSNHLFEELKKRTRSSSKSRNGSYVYDYSPHRKAEKMSLHQELKKRTKSRKESSSHHIRRTERGGTRDLMQQELRWRTSSRRAESSRNLTESRHNDTKQRKKKSKSRSPTRQQSNPNRGDRESLYDELRTSAHKAELRRWNRSSTSRYDRMRQQRKGSNSWKTLSTKSTASTMYSDDYDTRDQESLSDMSSVHEELRQRMRKGRMERMDREVPQYLQSGALRRHRSKSERSVSRESLDSSLTSSWRDDDMDEYNSNNNNNNNGNNSNNKDKTNLTYFIPGITGKPRCLEPTTELSEESSLEESFRSTPKATATSSFFIPGITGTARCLDSDSGMEDTDTGSELPLCSSSGTNRLDSRSNSTRSFRVTSRSPRRRRAPSFDKSDSTTEMGKHFRSIHRSPRR